MTDPIQSIETARQLVSRGVNPQLADELVAQLESETIDRTLAWFDAQGGRVGAGVLVAELRQGGRPARQRRTDDQAAYAAQITAWLAEHFPDLIDAQGRPSPGAFREVIALHHRYGKNRLSVHQHGARIRAAARAPLLRELSPEELALVAQRQAMRAEQASGDRASQPDPDLRQEVSSCPKEPSE